MQLAIAADADHRAEEKVGTAPRRAAVQTRLGSLSVLVNNAGIVVSGTVEELSLAEWRRSMAVNANSAFLRCKYALPLLPAAQPAAIVQRLVDCSDGRGAESRSL